MLLIVWGEGSSERVTRDVDLLGFCDSSPTAAAAVFRDLCAVGVEDDGVHFEAETIEAESIRAEQEYVGVRVTLRARVGNARIPVQTSALGAGLKTRANSRVPRGARDVSGSTGSTAPPV